ncbi:MAG: hypothetical protein ACYDHN_02645 [Solirubrobacteraceae bacterium]
MEIRSYRRVFDLERRVYSIDSLRLNPGGVPVRGIVYFLVLLAAGLMLVRLPLLNGLARVLPWYMRYLGLPGAGATVLGLIRIEGRTFHVAAWSLLRFWLLPRRLAGLRRCLPAGARWYPERLLVIPDGSDARMRAMRYSGPGAVLVAVAHERTGKSERAGMARWSWRGHRAELTIRQQSDARQKPDNAQVVLLAAGARMLICTARPGGHPE